jgi:hypothetical protein
MILHWTSTSYLITIFEHQGRRQCSMIWNTIP